MHNSTLFIIIEPKSLFFLGKQIEAQATLLETSLKTDFHTREGVPFSVIINRCVCVDR